MQGNAQLVEGSHQLWVDLLFLWSLLGRGKIDDVLEIYLGNIQMGPRGHLHGQPLAVGLQAEVEEPLRLALLPGNQAYDVLVQPFGDKFLLHLGLEAVLVLGGAYVFKYVVFLAHGQSVLFAKVRPQR